MTIVKEYACTIRCPEHSRATDEVPKLWGVEYQLIEGRDVHAVE